jgi:hypothetical protein
MFLQNHFILEAKMKTHHFHPLGMHPTMIALSVLVILGGLSTSCTFNAPTVDPAKRETDVARKVESTLNAEKVATYVAQQTLDAGGPVATQPANLGQNATIQAQQATLVAQSTMLSPQETLPPPADTPQVAPTLAPVISSEPIQILDWKMAFWVSLPNGCKGDSPCWRTNDDYKKHLGMSPMVLTSEKSFLIDSSWSRPTLVFWDKRKISNPGTVELIIEGTPILIKEYPRGQTEWSSESIDLSAYKGKEISIRFAVNGKWGSGGIPGSEWYLENIQIIPDFKQK